MALLILRCPECGDPDALECAVAGTRDNLNVTLVTQHCLCDPYHAWEDVWEEARERIYEHGELD